MSLSGARERYLPIADHGMIGDLHTVALVGTDGTIDWYCCPRFDSPSVFGAILDAERGGHFRIAPDGDGSTSKQLYLPDTNVLITRFLMRDGVGEVQDFMPPARTSAAAHRHRMIRRVVAVRGEMGFTVEVKPRFDYARACHNVVLTPRGACFASPTLTLGLSTSSPLEVVDGRDVRAHVRLRSGDTATFALERIESGSPPELSDAEVAAEFDATVAFWRDWLRRSRYSGRWREMVDRSALTLKLLTYAPTGAIVAAPTASLPEVLGGARNWDYRFTWMRDSAFTLYALLRLGFVDEAAAFMGWLEGRVRGGAGRDSGPLHVMYGIDGRDELPEEELSHFEGYMGSAPVRIGNGAAGQLQLDIYGELMDSLYLCNKYGLPIYHDGWTELTRSLEWLITHWDKPDEGIWETRGGRHDFTYSRLMSWVAFERAIRIAQQRGLPADARWSTARDSIYHQIMERGWHTSRRAFVQHYDTDVLDASLLLMPLCKFIAPTDPRWVSTLDAITAELVSDSLVYRYNADASPDGLAGKEATFSMCSFWWVEALARAGRLDDARLAFEKMLTYANHVGLYSEEIGPTGEQLGNFPQAFTHLALISAAFTLDRELG